MITFQDVADVLSCDKIIRAYFIELMGYADDGIRPAKRDHGALVLAPSNRGIKHLESGPELGDAFATLTPGRQRSWNER